MSTLTSLTGSLDDIVFEGRNQAYGAYQQRRSYQRHLGSALLIALTACTLLFLLPVAVNLLWPDVVEAPPIVDVLQPTQPRYYELEKVKPMTPPPAASQPEVKVTPHDVIRTRVAPDDQVKPTVESTLPPDIGPAGPAKDGVENPTGSTGGKSTASTAPDSAAPAVAAPVAPMLAPEVMPDFVGGRTALMRYLQKHLRYPAAAMAAQASGKVFVSFVVQTDGSIGEVTVLKGLGFGTEEAAARVVREMPAWTPGLQNNHPVPVRFTLPITFQFE
ncbi:energy transducer TonB [Hymenobacter ruricola]|uniref:TonB family protein n=1 Tax=Hymenobacter ruricola TaxID=2791023 RepID=A0ABS0I4I8_9BACT|nr:energy transducer TonB [Hymenobacter ruricola]MBF9221875.1 TonB family protein [Hymenobacter ruricola]